MRAIILAAGLGSRLQAVTKDKPKALVEVAGRPVIDYVLERILKLGVTEIALNLHYYPEQIKSYLSSQNYPCQFTYSYEPELLDTGGALLQLKDFLSKSENFILHNCDIITNFELEELQKNHLSKNHIATLAISKNKSDRFLWFNEKSELSGWENKQTGFRKIYKEDNQLVPYDYNCMSILSKRVFEYTAGLTDKFSLFELLFSAINHQEIVQGLDIGDSKWIDIGTPQDLAIADQLLR